MKNLTERQQEVLALLTAFQSEHGYPPTCGELAELMGGSSPNAAATVLQCLKRKGAITISRGKSRGINLVGVLSPAMQRDELLATLRDLYACNAGSAERAALVLKRYEKGATA